MNIAYFINHYPKVSHSFIRREILSLERQGFAVQRIALRGWDTPTPDPEDRLEQQRTGYVLKGGLWALVFPLLRAMTCSPARFLAALSLALTMARESRERSLLYHLIYIAEACLVLSWVRASGARHVHAHFGTNSAEIAMQVRLSLIHI